MFTSSAAIRTQLQALAQETHSPCVTISLNTHRTFPDNQQDAILLKNLVAEAKGRIEREFGHKDTSSLLQRLASVVGQVDVNYNLSSLHVFCSNSTLTLVRSPWSTDNSGVHISDRFAVRPLIHELSRAEEYVVMLLSQSGVHLYSAFNALITNEIQNENYPIPESTLYNTNPEKLSDPKHEDNLVREFLNRVDKAFVREFNSSGKPCVVVCTEDNYSRLMQVADKPHVYIGYTPVNYNQTAPHSLVAQAWPVVLARQEQRMRKAITEVLEAPSDLVLANIADIYTAAADGRGDLLVVHYNFRQPALPLDDRTIQLITDQLTPGAIDDVTSAIAWNVFTHGGRVVFTSDDDIERLGSIVLKVRF